MFVDLFAGLITEWRKKGERGGQQSPLARSEQEESACSSKSILHAPVTYPVGFNSVLNELHTCVPGWLPSTQWEESKEGRIPPSSES